jgi:hypothetical protein
VLCDDTDLLDQHEVCRRCQHLRPEGLPAEVADIVREVESFLTEALGMALVRRYRLELSDQIRGYEHMGPGVVVRGDFRVVEGRPSIRVLRTLEEPIFIAVFAHEYTHAWQAENCPPQSRELLEGFARWVQHKVLFELYEDSFVSSLEADQLEDYAPGLRACLAWERRIGEKALIRKVREWTHFPGGSRERIISLR